MGVTKDQCGCPGLPRAVSHQHITRVPVLARHASPLAIAPSNEKHVNTRFVCFNVPVARVFAQSEPPATDVRTMMVARPASKIRVGDVSEFKPAVAAVDSGGHCRSMPPNPRLPNERAFLYSFGPLNGPARNVVVAVDSLNRFVRYSDVRGDLRGPNSSDVSDPDARGPVTSITFSTNPVFGMLRNERSGMFDNEIRVNSDAVLDAPHLGNIRKMIEHVIATCGQP